MKNIRLLFPLLLSASIFAQVSIPVSDIKPVTSGKLLGRSTAGNGSAEQIAVGANLTLSGGILSASGGGGAVTSVNGQTGVVILTKTDIGLSAVPNIDATNATNITSGTLPAARIPATAVTPGAYTAANITIGADGRVTSAANGVAGTVTNVATGTGLTGGPITSTGTLSLANTAVTAGSYTTANITVDAQGRITAASNGSGGGGAVSSVSGTAGQVTVSPTTGDVIISLPSAITGVDSITAEASSNLTFTAGTGNKNIGLVSTGTGVVIIGRSPTVVSGSQYPLVVTGSSSVDGQHAMVVLDDLKANRPYIAGSHGDTGGSPSTWFYMGSFNSTSGFDFFRSTFDATTGAAGTVDQVALMTGDVGSNFNNSLQLLTTGAFFTTVGVSDHTRYSSASGYYLGITNGANAEMELVTSGNAFPRGIVASQYSTDTNGGTVVMQKARGTKASPTVIANGDIQGNFIFSAWDGSTFTHPASIYAITTGAVSGGNVPTDLVFTAGTVNGGTERFRLPAIGSALFPTLVVGGAAIASPSGALTVQGSAYGNSATTNSIFNGSGTWNNTANFVGSGAVWALRTDTSSGYNLDVFNGGSPVNAMKVTTAGAVQFAAGDVSTTLIGKTFLVKSGSNALSGTVTLSSGAGTISSTAIDATVAITFTISSASGTFTQSPYVATLTPGTGCTVAGTATDNSTYTWVATKRL